MTLQRYATQSLWRAQVASYLDSLLPRSAVSPFGLTLIDDADAAAARATLELVIGTDVQAQNADLQKIANATAWTTFTPTVSSSGGTLGSATAAGRYQQIGRMVYFSIEVQVTGVGSGSGNLDVAGFPVASKTNVAFGGAEIAIAGYAVSGQLAASGTTMFIRKFDAGNIVTLNAYFSIAGVYEAA